MILIGIIPLHDYLLILFRYVFRSVTDSSHSLILEGIFYPAAIISAGSLHDLHHVKPHRLTVVQPALHAEMIVHPADFPLFPYVHSLAGISLPAACPCFYFHDEQRIFFLADQVNLTPPALIIMYQNTHSLFFQKRCRRGLSSAS